MSRKTAGGENRDETPDDDGNPTNDSKKTLLGRRRFVQATGAGLAATIGFTGAASAASYETITLSAGEHWSHSLSDGETFENVLFDCTASNTRVSLKASASNWTIRNVGIKGVHDQSGGHSVMALNAQNGSDCLIENVYMGDGSQTYDGAGSSETAAWVSPRSSGTITFRRCYFQGWQDNAIYASACGRDGNGPVVVDQCYAANNNHADYRIGSSGSVVKNSVVEHNGSGDRGVWCWYNDDLEIRNCNIDMGSGGAAVHAGPYAPGGVDVYDTQFDGRLADDGRGDGRITLRSGNGSSPNCTVPDGVPQNAEAAASGDSSSGDSGSSDSDEESNPFGNSLLVDSPAGGAIAEYEIVTTGEVARSDDAENDDRISENGDGTYTIDGLCSDGWTDSFTFEGEVSDYTISGGRLDIVVNGETINPVETSSLRIETPENGELARYEIITSGRITRGDEAEPSDRISQNDDGTWTLAGVSGDGAIDTFEFEGAIEEYSVSGGRAAIVVDGETINPVETNSLRLETPENGDLVNYEIVTSGRITPGDKAEPSDTISQNDDGTWTLAGISGDGAADTFEFEGEIRDYSIDGGAATIYVDDEEYTSVEVSVSSLRLETPTNGDLVHYEITATGEIIPGDEAEPSDTISQNDDGTWTLAGVSGDGAIDTFEFEGEITDHSFDGGGATIYVDGQEYATHEVTTSSMRVETPTNGDLVHYEITATGEIIPGDKAEPSDRISRNGDGTWTLSGVSGDGAADTFTVEGEVQSFDSTGGEVTLLVDGTEVAP